MEKNLQLAKYQHSPEKRESNKMGVRCTLCPHFCFLKEGERGLCKTRVNRDGTLYTTAFNNPCSIAIDPIEKKPLFHFLQGSITLSLATAGCNLRCLNCQNHTIATATPDEIPSRELTAKEIVKLARQYGCPSISYTYTEPTVYYEYMLEIAKEAKKEGLKNIIVSNGYINRAPLLELIEQLDAANIDLKSFHPETHKELTGGKLEPILETIKELKKGGVHLELTHLMIPQYSDQLDNFEEMVKWLVAEGFSDTPLHLSRFYPNHKLSHLPRTPRELILEAIEIAEAHGIKNVHPGNMW